MMEREKRILKSLHTDQWKNVSEVAEIAEMGAGGAFTLLTLMQQKGLVTSRPLPGPRRIGEVIKKSQYKLTPLGFKKKTALEQEDSSQS